MAEPEIANRASPSRTRVSGDHPMSVVGTALVFLGLAALASGSVAAMQPSMPLLPIVGAIAVLAAGVALVLVSRDSPD